MIVRRNANRGNWRVHVLLLLAEPLRRWLGAKVAREPEPARSVRTAFEERYVHELFLADQLLSRGGPALPEDRVWLDRLLSAYEAASHAAYDPSRDLPDPWAMDTQPEVFENEPEPFTYARSQEVNRPSIAFSASEETDAIVRARALREQASRARKELRPALAALVQERERIRRTVEAAREMLKSFSRSEK